MLHVRVVSPPGSTDHLVETLSAEPGVRNLVVVGGAARRPDGDAVQLDLVIRFANPVLRQVRAQLNDQDSMVIEQVAGAVSGPEEREGAADRKGTGQPDAPRAASGAAATGDESPASGISPSTGDPLVPIRANALIGVFISVTTIPAASDMGLSAAYGSWSEARG